MDSQNAQWKTSLSAMGEKNIYSNNDLDSKNNVIDIVFNNNINLSMSDGQILLSFLISDDLLIISNKREVEKRVLESINLAIRRTNENYLSRDNRIITKKEVNDLMIRERQRMTNLEIEVKLILKQYSDKLISFKKEIRSTNENINITINGYKNIENIYIDNELITINNKKRLEEGIISTVNQAIQEIQKDIDERAKKVTEECFKLQEKSKRG